TGGYELEVTAKARSLLADGNGEETIQEFNGELELEVLITGSAQPLRLLAQAKDGTVRFQGHFEHKPLSVALDPRLLYLDRDLTDNHLSVVETSR
ncbi:MAG: hypothetical protein ACI9F9_002952, partial [Candidatus Paceibacteria bacterium]